MQELNINKTQTIGTTAQVVSLEKDTDIENRSSIIIINTSPASQLISISIDAEAVAGQGIVLQAGGSWQDSRDGLYLPTQKVITAVSSAAGGTIAIQERFIKK